MTTLGRNLKLDPLTWDLAVENNNLVMIESVSQAVRVRLRKIRGEWFRNTEAGVPWLGDNENKLKSVTILIADIRRTILETLGVGTLTRFQTVLDPSTRKLSIAWTATTDLGELSGREVF